MAASTSNQGKSSATPGETLFSLTEDIVYCALATTTSSLIAWECWRQSQQPSSIPPPYPPPAGGGGDARAAGPCRPCSAPFAADPPQISWPRLRNSSTMRERSSAAID